jgi:hypothetical protein
MCRHYVLRFEPTVHVNVNLEGNMPSDLPQQLKFIQVQL